MCRHSTSSQIKYIILLKFPFNPLCLITGFIPEGVFSITSVSTRKTQQFETAFGVYQYRTVKPELFWGYKLIYHKDAGIKIAEPEKALLDFFCLNRHIVQMEDMESLRLNRAELSEKINLNRLDQYADAFDNELVRRQSKCLIAYMINGYGPMPS